jgi:NAD(P)H dehydrogenase (quinone)
VARRLRARGTPLRLLTWRDAGGTAPAGAVPLPEDGGPGALRRAFEGVDAVYLVPLPEGTDRVRRHAAVIEAAAAAGVRRIVYHSFVGAAARATFTLARDHHATEERIRAAGVRHTVLRAAPFLEVLRWAVGEDGVIRAPAGAGRLAPVARDDVADVAAAVLLGGADHDGATYDVTGPERLSMGDIAAELARALGRPLPYIDEPVDEAYAWRAALGPPAWRLEAWVTTYLQIARGELDVQTDVVPRIAGHPARSLRAHLASHPDELADLVQG